MFVLIANHKRGSVSDPDHVICSRFDLGLFRTVIILPRNSLKGFETNISAEKIFNLINIECEVSFQNTKIPP